MGKEQKNVYLGPRAPAVFAFLVTAIASLVLTGWFFDLGVLKSVLPSYITMKANTAIGFEILAGVLGLGYYSGSSPRLRKLELALVIAIMAVGAATLVEYLFNVNLGIDQFVVLDHEGGAALFPPGRLAPITAIDFVFLGAAILMRRSSTKFVFQGSQIFFIFALVSSFQALVGYAVNLTYLFGSAFYTQMAVHTAICFILITIGFLAAQPNVGIMEFLQSPDASGYMLRRLIAACVLVPPLMKYLQVKGEGLGLFDADFGVLIQVMGNVILLTSIVWSTVVELHRTEQVARATKVDFFNVQSQLDVIASALPALVAYVDLDQRHLFANAVYKDWFGPDTEAVGKTVAEVLGPQAYADALPSINEVLMGRRSTHETTWLLASGERRQVQVTYTPDFNNRGHQRGFVILANDVTELKHAVEARDDFLSIASHELKTPVTALLLQNEVRKRKLARGQLFSNEEISDLVRADKVQLNRLSQHIEVMLDVSRISLGKMDLSYEEFNLDELIREVTGRFALEVESHGAYVALTAAQPIHGSWDRFRVEQALSNLMTNALKYGNHKPIEVLVEATSEQACIKVTDHGIGIRDADKDRIFEKFERAVDKDQASGFGLGLYLVRDIAQRHGGTITFEKGIPDGSVFTLRLPLRPEVLRTDS